jgi:hypothetical protein
MTITTTTTSAPSTDPSDPPSSHTATVSENVTHHSTLTLLRQLRLHTYQPIAPYLRGSQVASLSISILEEEIIACFPYDPRVVEILNLVPSKRYSSLDKSWRFPVTLISEVVLLWKALGGAVDSEIQEMATRKAAMKKRRVVPDHLSLLLSSPSFPHTEVGEKRPQRPEALSFPPVLEISVLKCVDLLTSATTLIARLSSPVGSASASVNSSSAETASARGLHHLLEHLDIPPLYLNPLGDAVTAGSGDWLDMSLAGFCDYLLEETSRGYELLFQIYRPVEGFAERILQTFAEEGMGLEGEQKRRMLGHELSRLVPDESQGCKSETRKSPRK